MKLQAKFLVVMLVVVMGSCGKETKEKVEPAVPVEVKKKEMKLSWDLSNPVARATLCEKHGGRDPYSTGGIEWEMATCRSLCTRGLGFKCGHRIFARCMDGFPDEKIYPGSCPNGASAFSRTMGATMSFFTDGTLKLYFLNSVPADEIGNTNFEIEGEDLVELPGILLDGISYSGFRPRMGTFKIDYSDGQFGSVTLPVTLIQN